MLQRIASISLADGQTRFTIWNMAFKGVLERPLTGWGQEGFNYVFNKYYDPSLYAQEQWFDRAHNAFIDWLSAGGIPAFLLYLSLFGSALALLWKNSVLSRQERVLLTAALVGYAVHNFFVFDNLYSYIYFFALLALIDSQVARPIKMFEEAPELSAEEGVTYALPITAIVLFALIWFVNVPGMQTASKLIVAISPSSDPSKNLAVFEGFAAHPPFAMQEVREQMISFANAIVQNASVSNELKQRAVSLTITEMQKQVTSYPRDARGHLQLSYAYRTNGDSANALKEMQAAISLSPKKIGFFIEKGTLEWSIGDLKAAQEDFNTAYALGPQFSTLALYAAVGNIAVGDIRTADKILIDTFGTTNVDSDIIAVAYYETKNWPRFIALWKLRADKPGASAKTLFGLASAYYMSGDTANAIRTIKTVIARYPDAAAEGTEAIRQIQEGK